MYTDISYNFFMVNIQIGRSHKQVHRLVNYFKADMFAASLRSGDRTLSSIRLFKASSQL